MSVLTVLLAAAVFTRPMERVTALDPAKVQSVYDAQAVQLVYDPVLDIDYEARPYRLIPGYCELPEVSSNGLNYIFRTRKGPAADVIAALERLRDPQLLSPNGWIMKGVGGVRATDAHTVEVCLEHRIHYFPWLMAMTPTGVVGKDGSGTGAFRLESWWRNHEMTFVRRVPEPGSFDRVRYLVIDDTTTKWLMFLRGEVDFLGEISRDNWDSVIGPDGQLDASLAAQGIRLYSMPTLEVLYLGFNMNDPVVGTNRALRQALNAAFDFPAWRKFYNGRISPCDGPVPVQVDGHLNAPFRYAYDLEKAKRLLAEAGYPGGIDPATGRRLRLTLTIGRPDQESRESGELLVSFYARIGINLELQFMTWNAFQRAVNEGRTQICRIVWVGDYPDAQNFLQLFYSRNVSPGPNHSFYANAEFDRSYEAALDCQDVSARNRCWRTCQEIVREDCPWVFLNFNNAYSLVRPKVTNYIPSDFPYGSERHYRRGEER